MVQQIEPHPTFKRMPAIPPASGMYSRIAACDYFRWSAWSHSTCKHVGRWDQTLNDCVPAPHRSPAHLRAYLEGELDKTSDDLRFGSIYHAFLLEPWRVDSEFYRVIEPINHRSKEGKDLWKSLVQKWGENNIIDADEWERAIAMARAAGANKEARNLINAVGDVEVSASWIDTASGMPCKGRFDKVIRTDERDFILDLKTTVCSHWNKFALDAAGYGYHVQAAMYADGYEALTGRRPRMLCLAQEKKPPYPCVIYEWREDELTSGRVIYRAMLRVIARCLRTNQWPCYSTSIVPLVLPEWGMAEDDTVTETEGADRE